MTIRNFEGMQPRIDASVRIDATALIIGDVAIGADSSVWPMAVIRGDVNAIRIGARTNIQDGAVVHVTHDGEFTPGGFATSIGDDVTVGHRAIIHACTIGDRVLVGMGAIVMDGAVVADDVIIGAGALVPPGRKLVSGQLYVGSPVHARRALTDEEYRMLPYSAHHYVDNARRHGNGDGSDTSR